MSNVALGSSGASCIFQIPFRKEHAVDIENFFEQQIESDTSSAYSDGLRDSHEAVVKYGPRRILDQIRNSGSFPTQSD